ncbi:hypothetical protein NA8A_23449 [Nitratireductor indicus C115]|uniref:Phage tail tape measure protein domain-containing protein n=1 Tax=Nitratireductor indicus C115 TaxID=1231190 RepID=K2NKI1_9HYPH|nr:phage tail tape measure protein [Nitratireductor indicus]EKF39940.1 hypothetical protein NA8A_23449 [Nitratireductor indicus C115]SFQ82080.1 Phage-related minor tail protein [Nitratireductor indicus]
MAQGVIGSLRVNLGIDTAQFGNGLKKAESGLQRFGKLARTGLLAAGAAATAAAGGLAVMVKGTINSADEMAKASRSFGVPIEELSRLRYAADLSGVSFSNLGNSLRTLNKNAYDASKGTGAAKDAFAELGVNVANTDGSLKSATQLMGEVADALQNVDDETRKAALSGKIFGERYGPQLASLLAGGSEGINKLTAEAGKFGQVFTEEMGANAEQFNDNISRLTGSIGSLAASITASILPALTQFSDFAVSVAAGFSELDPAIQTFISSGAALTAGLAALAIPLGAVALAIGAIGAPVIAVSAAIAGLTAAVVAFYPQIKAVDAAVMQWARNFDAAFLEMLNAAKTKTAEIIASAGAFASSFLQKFVDLHVQMYEIGVQIMQGLWNGIKSMFGTVTEGIASVGASIRDRLKGLLGIHSPSTVFHEIGVNIMQGLANGMNSMASGVTDIAGSAADGITSSFEGIGSGIAEAIKGTKEWKDVALDAIRSVATSILSNMNFGGGIFGGLLKGLLGGLVGFANGGSFTVGGAGAVDSQLVAFKATPGETVDIRKPGQDMGGGGALDVRVSMDRNGNLQAYVEQTSGRVSAQVVRAAAPGIIEGSTQATQAESRNRPGFFR